MYIVMVDLETLGVIVTSKEYGYNPSVGLQIHEGMFHEALR